MAFVVRVDVAELPTLADLIDAAGDRLGMDVQADEVTTIAADQGERSTSWCPWPHPRIAIYVPGASTRGVELLATRGRDAAEVVVSVAALATWSDWRLAVAVCQVLAGPSGTLRVEGEGEFLAEGVLRHFEQDDQRYLNECVAGVASVEATVRQGRVARIGGPAGHAAIGPRTWIELIDDLHDPEDLPVALIERIQGSIEARGFERYHEANPMWLDGRDGREVLAVVLAPDVDTLLRDPEYVLIGDDLEADGEVTMWLLPFHQLEGGLPGVCKWLDDRTAALPAIPRAQWTNVLAQLRPLLVSVPDVLDR